MDSSRSDVFLQFADSVRKDVDAALDRYTQPRDALPERLRAAVRHSLLAPGKRLRPLLVLMAAEACGGSHEGAMPAACAVEMVHAYSLIHDDLPAMDDDDLRRGLPSCHAKYGEAAAILAGDALLARAFEVCSSDIGVASAALRCVQLLSHAAGETALVGGQFDDLSPESSNGNLQMLERIHSRKTGALFRAALQMGGACGGGTKSQLDQLDRYGEKLGLAFQVVDDLLDETGDANELGKRTNKDFDRGKLTYPRLLGEEESRRLADSLIHDSLDALTAFGDQAREMESLAYYVLERTR